MVKHDKQWFIDRVGKRIYRTETTCRCSSCVDVYMRGLVIIDEQHADYLHLCQETLNLFYFDENI